MRKIIQKNRLLCLTIKILAALLLVISPITQAQVHEFKLDNGLKVIVKEDHRAPVVVSQIWYKVGSSYEHSGITGVSHVLEHMMFKGTQKYGAGEFSRIIAENGGRENAFTGQDYTAYFQQLEKSRLATALELEADRMRGLLLQPEEFAKEVKVVMEERRMRTEDNPRSLTYEQFKATAFVNSPYHNPIIGWMEDLKSMHIDDLRKWYDAWYSPNNATLVVVGDVNASEVFDLAKKYFGPIKKRPVPILKPQREITQKGLRRVNVRVPAELPYIIMGYKVPVVATTKQAWEPYALELLAGVLDGSNSGRFEKTLIRGKQIAASTSISYGPYSRITDMFVVSGTPAQGNSPEKLEKSFLTQIKDVQTNLIPIEELDRVRAQLRASKIYERDSIFYQAMQIGTLETVGLRWTLMDEYLDQIQKITPQQLKQVANKYLLEDALTIAVLDPLPLSNVAQANTEDGDNVK
ncbi:MAG: insulinase family protein [Gammaproteobacteria bacterium]|nr:insulinase family protein [Gammaproteobacteria bacterium]